MKIVVVGSSNTDLIVQANRAPRAGETVIGHNFAIAPGGKGANQAVAAARLGAEVVLIARVGDDDFGTRAVEGYQGDGIDNRFIKADPTAPSGVALIVVEKGGENRIIVVPGANGNLSPEDVRAAEEVIAGAQTLLVQLEIPLETVEEALALGAKRNLITVLNPAPARPVSDAILKHVRILTPNEVEASVLTGLSIGTHEEVEKAAQMLLAQGPEVVIVTLGAEGALLVTEQETTLVPGFPVEAVDTTAAGDAFNGGLAVALARGDSLGDAVRYGCAAGALSVTKLGAQPSLPIAAEVEKFLALQG
jgi:ribokinase